MKNLNTLIDQWIGEERYISSDYDCGYNCAIQNFKSRKQELIEGIYEMQEKNIIKFLEDNGYRVIKELTNK